MFLRIPEVRTGMSPKAPVVVPPRPEVPPAEPWSFERLQVGIFIKKHETKTSLTYC